MAALVLLLFGCDADEIRVYHAPKDPPAVESAAAPMQPGQPDATGMTWTVPDGWRELPGERQMRLATYAAGFAGEGDAELEVAVSAFPGDVGGTLANINRWRDQLGLDALTDDDWRDHVEPFDTGDVSGWTMRIVNPAAGDDAPAAGMLAAIIRTEGADRTWFVRASDAPAVLAEREADFVAFVRSFEPTRSDADASVPPGGPSNDHNHAHDDAAGEAHSAHGGAGELTWDVPSGWHAHEPHSPVVYGAFHAHPPAGQERADVAVTPLRGDGGGMLANVNMWRRQLGLPSVSDLDEQPMDAFDVDGRAAKRVTLEAEPADGRPARSFVIVTLAEDDERTWFFRLSGPAPVVRAEAAAFDRFVRSVRFP